MRIQRLLLLGLTLLLTTVLSSVLAQEFMVTQFEAIGVSCADETILISDEPMIAGRNELVFFQGPSDPYFMMVSTFYPDAYPDSSLVTPGEGLDTADGGYLVIHSGFGTGALKGVQILYVATPAVDMEDLPCEPVGPVARIEGVIKHQAP